MTSMNDTSLFPSDRSFILQLELICVILHATSKSLFLKLLLYILICNANISTDSSFVGCHHIYATSFKFSTSLKAIQREE